MTRYLSNRRAHGRAYLKEEDILMRVRKFLSQAGNVDLDQLGFDQWRAQFRTLSSSTRVIYDYAVYNFCRFRRRSEPACFLPDRATLTRPRPHPLPTLIEPQQVARLLRYVSALPCRSQSPVRSAAMRIAIVLLYTAGLRRGEVVRLTLSDVEAKVGVLHIQASKFHKSRWIPLSAGACAELHVYLEARRAAGLSERPTSPLLCTAAARAYTAGAIYKGLKYAMRATGVCDSEGRCPRVQDFRHSFAVAALLRWYEEDADVQTNLPKLALYMGHVSIASTAYYLRWMPAVMVHAAERFARSCEAVIDREQ
ncbi:tyrosine-type recombinase/integrase [Variovorax sp. LjRoot178]|uniref:tyrosine-type recombinase/integrase n=1 Tax=Variovorax sp. LjRoot178 TaxID=3342277 RepID=UPI003ECEAFE3